MDFLSDLAFYNYIVISGSSLAAFGLYLIVKPTSGIGDDYGAMTVGFLALLVGGAVAAVGGIISLFF